MQKQSNENHSFCVMIPEKDGHWVGVGGGVWRGGGEGEENM